MAETCWTNKVITVDSFSWTELKPDLDCDHLAIQHVSGEAAVRVRTVSGDGTTEELLYPSSQLGITATRSNSAQYPPKANNFRFTRNNVVAYLQAVSGVVDILRRCVQ